MKNFKLIAPLLLLLILPALSMAQEVKKKTEVVYIQTSAQCGECQQTIEAAVNKLKGIKKAELNLTDSKLMVEYTAGKTSPDEIKTAIVNTGYDADEMKADAAAYKALPMCCKKDGGKH
ncbi:MAG: cation transporter [Chitinophagales bacterium]